MQNVSPEVEFSLFELEQAGLLDSAELHLHKDSRFLLASLPRDRNVGTHDVGRTVDHTEVSAPDESSLNSVQQLRSDLDVTESARLEREHQADLVGTRNSRADHGPKRASNREHQRRFRLRQKARAQAVEQQLVSTIAELQGLKARQLELELLLQNAHITQDQSTTPTAATPADQTESKKNVDGTPLLSINLPNRQALMTTEEIVELSIPDFSALWADYIREIGTCLLQLPGQLGSSVQHRLHQRTFEAIRLVGRRLRLNPAGHKGLITSDARSPFHAAGANPSSELYKQLLAVLNLSRDQLEDMMLLRQLYITRRHLLNEKQSKLMVDGQQKSAHPLDSVIRMSDLAAQLVENAAEEHTLLYKVSRAFYCGILNMKQVGEVMVHSYPRMPIMEDMLNTFATELGYPSATVLVANAHTDPMTDEWTAFWQYVELVNPDVAPKYDHIPLCDPSQRGSLFGRFNSIQSFKASSHQHGTSVATSQHNPMHLDRQQSGSPAQNSLHLY